MKKLFTLFALMCLMVSGAWAEGIACEFTPSTINAVEPAELTTVKLTFTTDNFGTLAENIEHMPTLTMGDNTITADAITFNDETYDYEITFPITNMADGIWTLTIPEGTFTTVPATEGTEVPAAVPVAAISVNYNVKNPVTLTIQDRHLYTIKGAFANDVLLPLVRNGSSLKAGEANASPQIFVFFPTTYQNVAELAPLYKLGTVEGNGYFTYGAGVGNDAVPMAFLTSSTQLQGGVNWDGTPFKEGYFGIVGFDKTNDNHNNYRTYVTKNNENVKYFSKTGKIFGSNQLQGTGEWSYNYILEEITGYTVYDVVVDNTASGATIKYTGADGKCLTTTAQGNGGYLVVSDNATPQFSDFELTGIGSGFSAVVSVSGTTITISAEVDADYVPETGYYYIKDRATDKYLYNDFQNANYTQSGGQVANDNGYVWHIKSQNGINTVHILNGEGSGYKASAETEEVNYVNIREKNWDFIKYTGKIFPVEVKYAIFGEYVPFYGPWMTFSTNNAARHGGFITYGGSGIVGIELYGYSDNGVIGQLSPDGTQWVGATLEPAAGAEDGNIANLYFHSQQDEDRIAEVFDRSYDIFNNHLGKPGYGTEANQDLIDSDVETGILPMMQAAGAIYPYVSSIEEMLGYVSVLPFQVKYILGRLNDYVESLEIKQPEYGEAYHIAVRGNDYTGKTKYYLKNDGSVTTNIAEADVFVMGKTNDNTCDALFVSNNNKVEGEENSGPHYLQNHNNSAFSMSSVYSEDKNALKLETMMNAEGNDITNAKLYRYGTFSVTGTDGKVITYDEVNKTWSTLSDHAYMNDIATSAIELIPVEYPYNKPKFTQGTPDGHQGGYASIWLPYPMVFPAGVEVYRATDVENDGILILKKVNTEDETTVAAGGYILRDMNEATTAKVLPAPATPGDVSYSDTNIFVGSTEKPLDVKEDGSWPAFKEKYVGTAYVLANKDKGIGYYKYKETETYLPKGKAIWFSNYTSSAESLQFSFDDAITAIEALHGNTKGAEIYDLQGRRLNKVQKGQINVINGQKVMFN